MSQLTTGKAQLLAFSKFVCNGVTEQFLFCKPLPETIQGQVILDADDSYFTSHDFSWKSYISICTDGVPSMSGSLEGFITLSKQNDPGIVFTHCFLHREALISNQLYLSPKSTG
jgi:hypothetical protein